MCYIGHTIEPEGVAVAYPCHVGLEHTYTSVAHFFDDIALKQGLYTFFGMKVALCPETYLYAFRTGIITKLLEILNVAIERGSLAIAGSVAIVGQEPSKGHIVIDVSVNGSAG